MTKILVVDDDQRLQKTLKINLVARGYEVILASTGAEALKLASSASPDIIILDMGLPDIDGSEVLEGIRGWSSVPVVILTARADPLHSAASLDKGADDYVTKPFAMEELLARIRAALRHAHVQGHSVIEAGNLRIDLAASRILKNGEDLHLTPTEWGVLKLLLKANGGLVRKETLLAEVWGPGYADQGHYLRIYTSQLRRKLEDDPAHPVHLITEVAAGYRFIANPLSSGDQE